VPLPDEVTEVTSRFLAAADERAPGLVEGLYLHGSLALTGEFFPGSDIDFVAVLPARPGGAELDALAAAHEAVRAQRPRPPFEGIHLVRADLAGPPDACPEVPFAHEGRFEGAGRFSVNPVTWHELAGHAITVRGPALAGQHVWADDRVLWDFTHANLGSYWAKLADLLVAMPERAGLPEVTAWCVLGISRLHHLLATGAMTSKSGAGRYALTAFGPRWHPIIHEALRARERPWEPSGYGDGPARGQGCTEFTAMALRAGLALTR
jgi:aminoglycoside adenylyltransferase-like protein/nucleotidyltransferase-like protein